MKILVPTKYKQQNVLGAEETKEKKVLSLLKLAKLPC